MMRICREVLEGLEAALVRAGMQPQLGRTTANGLFNLDCVVGEADKVCTGGNIQKTKQEQSRERKLMQLVSTAAGPLVLGLAKATTMRHLHRKDSR